MKLVKKSRFGRLLQTVKKGFSRLASKFSYDFWEKINDNEIANSSNPAKTAVRWYRENYMRNPDRYVKRRMVKTGTLVIFDYDNPKYKDTAQLPWFDTQPLVLVLTPFITKDERIRVLGINLHLLPPKIRRLVLYQAFLMYKSAYTSQLFTDKDTTQVTIEWQRVKNVLEKYGAGFAIRMYIPSRMTNVIEFTQDDWAKAVWIPSKGYHKITASKLEHEWKEFVKKQGRKIHTAGEGHNSSV